MNLLRTPAPPGKEDEIRDSLAAFQFFHRFELFEGLETPGHLPTNPFEILERNDIEKDLSGLRAVDVGCMEGSMAFEMERRGANASAVDIHDPDEIAFNLCKQLLGSSVDYVEATVYDLAARFDSESLDLIIFRGVYYHLKHPLAALEAIATTLKPGGRMIISGECLINEAYNLSGLKRDPQTAYSGELADVPLTVCYPGFIEGVPSSIWFVPNVACIHSWLNATGFDVVSERWSPRSEAKLSVSGADRALQRYEALVVRNATPAVDEHPIWHWKHKTSKRT